MEQFSHYRAIKDNKANNDLEKLAQAALEYLKPWIRSSREFTQTRINKWKLLEDLYHNRRDLSSWNARENSGTAFHELSRAAADKSSSVSRDWQSDIILSPSYIVDTWADRAYQSIFNGPEWLTVIPEESYYETTTDNRYPTSFKLQELLTKSSLRVRPTPGSTKPCRAFACTGPFSQKSRGGGAHALQNDGAATPQE